MITNKKCIRHRIALVCMMALLFGNTKCYALQTSAVSAVVIETSTNSIIYQKNPHARMPMASTTKIMTALCAIEAGNIDRSVIVASEAVGIEGSSIYLAHNERITVRELIVGLMLHSGNDAAVAIACAVSGSVEQFVELMNTTAKRIGAANTHFDNPNGLDGSTHYTTAYDLALITSYALKNREFADIVSTYTATISNGEKPFKRQLKNHNKLLKLYEGCTGVKTGFTKRSGRCLVSSARRDMREIVAVTLNDGNDWQDHVNMLDYGFENTVSKRVVKKGTYIQKIPVDGGIEQYTDVVADRDVYVTLPKNAEGIVNFKMSTEHILDAPVAYGRVAGSMEVVVDGKSAGNVTLVCSKGVAAKEKNQFLRNVLMLFELILQIY